MLTTCLGRGQDYDSDPDNGGGVQEEDGYICALSEPQDADDTYEESYEAPPSADTLKPPPPPRVQHSHNTGNRKHPDEHCTQRKASDVKTYRDSFEMFCFKLVSNCIYFK